MTGHCCARRESVPLETLGDTLWGTCQNCAMEGQGNWAFIHRHISQVKRYLLGLLTCLQRDSGRSWLAQEPLISWGDWETVAGAQPASHASLPFHKFYIIWLFAYWTRSQARAMHCDWLTSFFCFLSAWNFKIFIYKLPQVYNRWMSFHIMFLYVSLKMLVTYENSRRRQWHPTPVVLPGKSRGQRSLVGCSPWGLEESDTPEWLHFHFSRSCIGEGNGNPLQCSCPENPRDGGASWAAVYGVAQSRTRLKRLSSSMRILNRLNLFSL